jgi:hypothetical protein
MMNFEIGLEPQLRVEIIIHVIQAKITGYPGAVDNQGHGHLVQFFQTGCPLEGFPLCRFHFSFPLGEILKVKMIEVKIIENDRNHSSPY